MTPVDSPIPGGFASWVSSRDQAAAKTYYSLHINAARAEVEPMAEPRNPAHVLGVGGEMQSFKGPVFAAYFAATRDRFDAEPNYKGGLFVLVDGAVYAVRKEKHRHQRSGAVSPRASFTLLRGDRPQRSVEYPLALVSRAVLSANPGMSCSQDFLREMSAMVQAYRVTSQECSRSE